MQIKETKTYQKLKNKPQDNFPTKIILHHSGGTDKYPLADTSHHTAEIVESWHLSLGWEGMGYQYFLEKLGVIAKGRPAKYHGAHTKGYNTKSIGICLAGNFDATQPTKEQIKALKNLVAELRKEFGNIPVEPHRYFAS